MSSDRKSSESKAVLDQECGRSGASKPSQGGISHPEKQDGRNRHEAISAPAHGVIDEHKKDKVEFDQTHKEFHKNKPAAEADGVKPKPGRVASLIKQQVGTAGTN